MIVDFMNYVHRCRVGTLNGEFVIIYNFFKNLRATVEQFQPAKIFFALEGYPKYRHNLFSAYKKNRMIKLASSIELERLFQLANEIQRLLLMLPVTLVRHSNFEADDLIFTLCENMKEEHLTIISNDSDYIQLLQRGYKNCQVYNPIRKEFMDAPAHPYVAWKALAGDKSDNIPALLSNAKATSMVSSPEKFCKFLSQEENRANFNINRQLIEFLKVPEEDISFIEGISSFDKLKEEFERMEFKSFLVPKTWNRFVDTFDCLQF